MMMMMLLLLVVGVADGCRFVTLACRLWCLQCPAVLIASWLDLPIGLRILCLPFLSVDRGCLRFVVRLLFFCPILLVPVLPKLFPYHHGHRACLHQSLNQIALVVTFVLLLLQSVLVHLVVEVVVRCLTMLQHNAQTVPVVFLNA